MKISIIFTGIVLILMLFAVPATATDYTLGIYGNANEDDTINMQDITYTELIILEYKEQTELSDANYDGNIDILDMTQIALIILGKEKELTFIDGNENTVTIDEPVESIIALTTESFESIRTLQATDRIVGVTSYIIEDEVFYPGYSDYPNIGSPWSIDFEKLFECDPDVVFTYTKYPEPSELEDKIKNSDIAVIRFDYNKPSSYVEEMDKLGYILAKKERASEYLDFYNEKMDEITDTIEALSDEEKPKVYLEADFGAGKSYYTCGQGHGHHELLVLAGGRNIFDDVSYGKDISPEDVIERNPDIIAKYQYPAGGIDIDADNTTELEGIRNEMLNRSELEEVTAIENEEVYVFTWYTTRGAARYYMGIGYLAKWFHPDLFADLDPKANYQEYLTKYQGLNIDLDKKGVFVYPIQKS
jgi:iron complex transport system substrate-binding protein